MLLFFYARKPVNPYARKPACTQARILACELTCILPLLTCKPAYPDTCFLTYG